MDAKPSPDRLTLAAIREAHERIRDRIHRTPVLTSATLDQQSGGKLFFKCENMQKGGAFKARGATNAVFLLSDAEAARGVATHSSGNHAAALSRAAKARGVPAYIVMPNNAPQSKRAAVERLGGKVVFCEPNVPAREAAAAKIVADTGATLIHPYDNLQVMAGQGTATIELLEQAPDLDIIVGPIGGGGLISGIGIALKSVSPTTRVIGVEVAASCPFTKSLEAGHLVTIDVRPSLADGLTGNLDPETITLDIVRSVVDDIVIVDEEDIRNALASVVEHEHVIVEGAAATGPAAIMREKVPLAGNVAVILTGANIDTDRLMEVVRR